MIIEHVGPWPKFLTIIEKKDDDFDFLAFDDQGNCYQGKWVGAAPDERHIHWQNFCNIVEQTDNPCKCKLDE
jgi:hypothetical protein